MYVNDKAHRFYLVSHLSPSFILSSLIPSHPVILSCSVSLSPINILSPLPVLSIGHAALRSRDNDAEGDPACSAAAVEQAGEVTIDTVVKAVGQEVGVIKGSVATAAGDDVPPAAAVAVSVSTIERGGNTTISSPGMAPKQPLPEIGLHDPLHSRLACPEFNSFNQGVYQISPREGLFKCRPLPKRGQMCDITIPPQSLNGSRLAGGSR